MLNFCDKGPINIIKNFGFVETYNLLDKRDIAIIIMHWLTF